MTDTLLEVRNVTHDFSLSKTACVRALDRLSFSIRRGEIYGLVGESGSGKSTAARCVMNLVQPRAGQIFYQGIDITNPRQFAANKKLLQTTADDFSGLHVEPQRQNEGLRHHCRAHAHCAYDAKARHLPQGSCVSDEIRGLG